MRRRVKWILETRCIHAKKYNTRLFTFNNWFVFENKTYFNSSCTQMMKYEFNAKHYINTLDLRKEDIYSSTWLITKNSLPIKYIHSLFISGNNYKRQITFETIGSLHFCNVPCNQIKLFLKRVKTVLFLKISKQTISDLDLRGKNIKRLKLYEVEVGRRVIFPQIFNNLIQFGCLSFRVKAQNIINFRILHLVDTLAERELRSFKPNSQLTGVYVNLEPRKRISNFPVGLKEIEQEDINEEKHFLLKKAYLPLLFQSNQETKILTAQKFNLRYFYPAFSSGEDQNYTIRPRGLHVTETNRTYLSNHPEMFDKVTFVFIDSGKFSLDYFNEGIKHMKIKEISLVSAILNRF